MINLEKPSFFGINRDSKAESDYLLGYLKRLVDSLEKILSGMKSGATDSSSGGISSASLAGDSLVFIGANGTEQRINGLRGNEVLWSGSKHMIREQSINLAKAVTSQRSGIILVFSSNSGNEAAINDDFQCFFIPKFLAENSNVTWHNIPLSTSDFQHFGAKYIGVSDWYIYGNDVNVSVGNRNGIGFDNSRWVLRYVIGV